MKYALLVLVLFSATQLMAQNPTGYIAFSLVDSVNRPVDLNEFECSVNTSSTLTSPSAVYSGKIQYDAENAFYYLSINESFFTSVITITLKNKKDQGPQSTFILNLNAKFKAPQDFKNLLIMHMPLIGKNLTVDIPSENASWQFVPAIVKKIDGKDVALMDITFMQNWYNQ